MIKDPNSLFPAKMLVIAPHMDDCVLACGGTLQQMIDKTQIHVVYATDGMKSPSPIVPWRDEITPDLGEIRRSEARTALSQLGVPADNLHFLNLPEAELQQHSADLAKGLNDLILSIEPRAIFMPFRYDRHPDHLVVNQVVMDAYRTGLYRPEIVEYFVYYRWRLLPGGDVRKYLDPEYLFAIDIGSVSDQKRSALDAFTSQTTKFYDWQTRPILTPLLLDEVSNTPEYFLKSPADQRPTDVFTGWVFWIRIVHRLEPFLQKTKYLVGAFLLRTFGLKGSHAG
jgi:LmbE family N-acetylglucosaminyl deacetylase